MTGRSMSTATPSRVQGIHSPIQFVSGGVIHEEAHALSEDGDNDCEMDKWVHPTMPGEKLAN